jgi:biotin transporter BioY
MRHAERSGQRRNSSVAQAVLLSAWHVVQGLGILYLSVIAGVIKVTYASAVVCQFVVPDMKRISFCLAQAHRFGIAG